MVFPFWDEDGESVVPVERRVIASLKWAGGSSCLLDAGVGMCEHPIPPQQLVAGAQLGMKLLVDKIAEIHPDFKLLGDEVGEDVRQIDGLLLAFESGEDWVGGDDASRELAFKIAQGENASLRWILLEMHKAGCEGFYGCWSY